ncbi:fluoride efflux transporter CrcB [Inhella sp.]|uniref:fluoride efflux transporter CrcB n=1 Tax=Inhella sp. TaxID=1921806 RepID=UPI0035B4175C
MNETLAVAAGAALGALARWQVGLWLNARHAHLPLGTLAVNMVGGLLIGMALVVLARADQQLWRLLLVTGFLGGLTTFSAFSAESLLLLQRGQLGWALAHGALHVLGALGAAAAGVWLARHWVS